MHRAAPPAASALQRLRRSSAAAQRQGRLVRPCRPAQAKKPSAEEAVGAERDEPGPKFQPVLVPDPRDMPSTDDIHVVTAADFEDYNEEDRLRPATAFPDRTEDFHDTFEGVSYDPASAEQHVVVDGVLHPPGFDPAAPLQGAPPGGWPLLLLLPAVGSVDVPGEPSDAALAALEASGYHSRAGSHVAALSFPFCPTGWAADGPRDQPDQLPYSHVRHESFLLHVVLPHLRATLGAGPVSLLGFAQGGWGAVSLLMRHPDVFAKAASWDAPLLVWVPDQTHVGMTDTFHSNTHYEPNYQLMDLAEDLHVAASLGSAFAAAALAAGGAPPGTDGDAAAAAVASAAAGVPRLGLFAADYGEDLEDAELLSGVLLGQGVAHVMENAPIFLELPADAPAPPAEADSLDTSGAFDLEEGAAQPPPPAPSADGFRLYEGCEGLPGLAAERGWTTWQHWLPPLLAFLERGEGRSAHDAGLARAKRDALYVLTSSIQQVAAEQAQVKAAAAAEAEAAAAAEADGLRAADAAVASAEEVSPVFQASDLSPELGATGEAAEAVGGWGQE